MILALFLMVMVGPLLIYGPTDLTDGTGTLDLQTLLGGLPFQAILTLALLAIVALLGWWRTALLTTVVDRRGWRPLYATLIFPILGLITFTILLLDSTTLRTTAQVFAVILLLNFLVGLSEELLFRGLLFGALRRRHQLITAIVASSIAFGLLHAVNAGIGQNTVQTAFQIVNATALGVVFCALALSANSLWPPVILHMLWNSYAMMGVAMAEYVGDVPGMEGDSPDPTAWSLLLPTFILMIGIAVLYGYCKNNSVRLQDVIPPEPDRI